MRLPDILRACTRSHLAAVAAALGWPDRAGAAKSTLVAELLVHLDGDAHLRAQFAAIEDEGLAALRVLLRYGGSMRQPAFEARFGPLRPYRPWSADSVRRPWRAPVSLTERVVYAGLVFPIGHGNSPHARQLVLPVEYGRCLPSVSARDRGIGRAMDHRAPRPARAPSAPVEPLADLALFLAYLNRHAIVPLHGRWLAPTHVRRLGGRLRPREPVCTAASELQAERLRFVHFVAERLGLVSVDGDHLRPSPLAVAWLSAPPPDALSEIRWAWLEAYLPHPDRDSRSAAISLAQRYRLPGAATRRSRAAVRALLRHLVELAPLPPGASLQPLAELARHVPPATVPCDGDPPGEETHIAWLDEVLRVELAGLGLLRQLSPSEPGRDACLALDSEDAKWLATHAAPIGLQPTVASEGPAPAFHAVRTIGSTPHAPPGTASPDRPTAHAHSTPSPNAGPIPSPCLPSPHLPIPCIADQNFAWHAPTALAGIVALAPWASWKERPGDDAARLHLTCASVQSALVARPRAPALAAGELTLLLRRHLAPPPPAAMLTLVHEWLQAAPLEHGPHASWPASSRPTCSSLRAGSHRASRRCRRRLRGPGSSRRPHPAPGARRDWCGGRAPPERPRTRRGHRRRLPLAPAAAHRRRRTQPPTAEAHPSRAPASSPSTPSRHASSAPSPTVIRCTCDTGRPRATRRPSASCGRRCWSGSATMAT